MGVARRKVRMGREREASFIVFGRGLEWFEKSSLEGRYILG